MSHRQDFFSAAALASRRSDVFARRNRFRKPNAVALTADVFLLWASLESGTWVGMLTSEMTSKHYYEVSYDIQSQSGIVSVFRKVSDNYYTKTRKATTRA